MTFQNGNTYNLNDQDLQYFITKTQLDKEPQNVDLIHSFMDDLKYNINIPGVKKIKEKNFIKELINQLSIDQSISTVPIRK